MVFLYKILKEANISNILDEILKSNEVYVKTFGDKKHLGVYPRKKFAILTCMDARLDPAKYAGFFEGDVHVIRNAGACANNDAIKSLIISNKLLGTTDWLIIHHTDCAMRLFNEFNDDSIDFILEKLSKHLHIAKKNHCDTFYEKDNLCFHSFTSLKKSVLSTIAKIRQHNLVPTSILIHGLVYDVQSGKLIEIVKNQ